MTEPTSAALGAALGAGLMATLGIEPAPIFWALVGASLGMSVAATAGRMRAGSIFVSVVLTCGLLGSWLSIKYFGGEMISRNMCSCVLAMFFHPLLQTATLRIPLLIDAFFKKLGLG